MFLLLIEVIIIANLCNSPPDNCSLPITLSFKCDNSNSSYKTSTYSLYSYNFLSLFFVEASSSPASALAISFKTFLILPSIIVPKLNSLEALGKDLGIESTY